MVPENFFVLSRENLALAIDEVVAIARGYDGAARVRVHGNLVLVRTDTCWERIHRRAAYVRASGRVVGELRDVFLGGGEGGDGRCGVRPRAAKTFACKVLNLSRDRFDPAAVQGTMGDAVSTYTDAVVSLDSPDLVVYMIISEEGRRFLGFSARSGGLPPQRPKRVVSHPSQLDWRLARAMINLCGLVEGQTVCDPFCGTGTTLLEAGSMGMRGIGIDLDAVMAGIARRNVAENGFESTVINGGFELVGEIAGRVDGVVTDVPYGQNTRGGGARPEGLAAMLPRGRRAAIMFKKGMPGWEEVAGGEGEWRAAKRYTIYRHKSLTRVIVVR